MGARDGGVRQIGYNRQYGRYVRRRRIGLGLTQRDLSARLGPGITPAYVSKMEVGWLPDALSTLIRMGRVFGDPLDVVLRESGFLTGGTPPEISTAQRQLLALTRDWTDEQIYQTARTLATFATGARAQSVVATTTDEVPDNAVSVAG